MRLAAGLLCRDLRGQFLPWYASVCEWADFISVVDTTMYNTTGDVYIQKTLERGSIEYCYADMHYQYLSEFGFASAKNIVFDQTRGKADWTVMIDSDELIPVEEAKKMKQELEKLPDHVGIGTMIRLNQKHPPTYFSGPYKGTLIPFEDWNAQIVASVWEEEPQHKILRATGSAIPFYAGPIHEEPGGTAFGAVDAFMYHFNRSISRQDQQEKMRLYCYLIKRCVDEPEFRRGVNRYWYTMWYKSNQEYVDRMAEEFKEQDERYHGYDGSYNR